MISISYFNSRIKLLLINIIFTALASCGGGGSGGAAPVPAPNNAPVFASIDMPSAPENQTSAFQTGATDEDGDQVSYALAGGNDEDKFSINTSSGAVVFIDAPDFEAPTDSDQDNLYEVNILADDGRGGTDNQAVRVVVTDVSSIELELTYPTASANLGGGANSSTISGNTIDTEDGEVLSSDIESLKVNDIDATFGASDNARWSAVVPVNSGQNTISVEALTATGESRSLQQLLNNEAFLADPNGMAIDTANNRALFADRSGVIYAVALGSNDVSVFSANDSSTGIVLDFAVSIIIDSDNNLAIVGGGVLEDDFSSFSALINIDLATGARTFLSTPDVGVGPSLTGPGGLVLDSVNERLFISDQSEVAVYEVDLNNGNRSVVSNASTGMGTNFNFLSNGIAYDSVGNRLFIVNDGADNITNILAVDLVNGDRTIFGQDGDGLGAIMEDVTSLYLDQVQSLLYAVGYNGLIAIDINSGLRTLLSNDALGEGVNLEFTTALDIVGDVGYVVHTSQDVFLEVSLITGDRLVLATTSNEIGEGLGLGTGLSPGLVMDAENNRVLVSAGARLMMVDVETGDRIVLSGNGVGSGPELSDIHGFVIDAGRALVLGDATLFEINLATGDRTVLSSSSVGTGNDLASSNTMAYDADTDLLYVPNSFNGDLQTVDLMTGNRTVLSGNSVGAGESFGFASQVALDKDNDRAIVVSGVGLFGVNLTTGDRTRITSAEISTATDFLNPSGFVFDEATNTAFIVDATAEFISVINVSTGEGEVLSTNSSSGFPYSNPEGLAVDIDRQRAFVINSDALLVVDLRSGEKAVASQGI